VAEHRRASIWWWTGGLVFGVAAFCTIGFGAVAVFFLHEARGDARGGIAGAQLPAVRSEVARLVSPYDPQAEVEQHASCSSDRPAQVEVLITVDLGHAEQVAADLERAALAAGWEPDEEASTPGQVARSFEGVPFGFLAVAKPATESRPERVLVRSVFMGPPGCD